ncbi:reverse transcriptase [Gossypium australe]|uniref:Reverse transcriptase n=1 Tax=Gossypium australe TaxID=47621 RepID=A0A5B6WUJ9_9ROSI|nr:reverse transcriptase [Gossypium australe]
MEEFKDCVNLLEVADLGAKRGELEDLQLLSLSFGDNELVLQQIRLVNADLQALEDDPNVVVTSELFFSELIFKTLPSQVQHDLIQPVLDDEIKRAMFSQGNKKASGPNSFSTLLFKIAWSIVGVDVLAVVHHFFLTSKLLSAFNTTTIVLVPKCAHATRIKQFRPISCCNIIYKCISKILTNRLSPFLPDLISPSQSVFIKGRNIVDNSFLAHELLRGYGRKYISPRCGLKVDLRKVFDFVNWRFIIIVLEAMKVPDVFKDRIEACITSSQFSISLNGGLVRHGVIKFHPKCKRVNITHLPFTNDLLISVKGSTDLVLGIWCILDEFYTLSGLQLNASKNEVFIAGVLAFEVAYMLQVTRFKTGQLLVHYLDALLVPK